MTIILEPQGHRVITEDYDVFIYLFKRVWCELVQRRVTDAENLYSDYLCTADQRLKFHATMTNNYKKVLHELEAEKNVGYRNYSLC